MDAQLLNILADTDLKKQQKELLEVDCLLKKAQLVKQEQDNIWITPELIRDVTLKYKQPSFTSL
jgi:hypothetical protein